MSELQIIHHVRELLDQYVADLEPGIYPGDLAAAGVAELVVIENLASYARNALAVRVADTHAWKNVPPGPAGGGGPLLFEDEEADDTANGESGERSEGGGGEEADPGATDDAPDQAANDKAAADKAAAERATAERAAAERARSAVDWLSKTTGTSKSKAREALNAAKKLPGLRPIDNARRNGELSEEQANRIADAADGDEHTAKDLIDTARNGTMSDLRRACDQAKLRQRDDQHAHDHAHTNRRARYATRTGAFWLELPTPPRSAP